MPAPALETIEITKRYGSVTAVSGANLCVSAGEVYGFLGRNGAGKTTTIRMLLGMVRPTSGEARVLGQRVGHGNDKGGKGTPSLWRRVGYMVEGPAAYPELTVRENLEAARWLQGVRDPTATTRVIERLGLGTFVDRRAGALSTGNLLRLGLARALLHEPELLILDEPTSGLDPAGVVEVRELIGELARDRGVTVFMSSHVLTEVERLATRIGVVHHGRLIEELSAEELDSRRSPRLEVGARDAGRAAEVLEGAGYGVKGENGMLTVADARAVAHPEEIARLLVEAGAPPTRLSVVRDDMETFFVRLTAGE